MRLLNVNTFQFGNFFNAQVPKYCILSHRWGDDEVTYENVKEQKINTMSAGYRKLHGACRLVQQLGYEWIWADMCCIDKSSSAELSEAINSMFVFYSQADLCIAYLTDVPASCRSLEGRAYYFYRSEWFTRGWTLQELLAPASLHFYDHGFNYIGSKIELCSYVSECTGIATKYLDGRKRFNDASIATRMSWASRRKTTRLEDEAYCLLGMFGVSIPPCYGEGAAAFYRLQCEILARSDDESILAWISPEAKDDEPYGLLAESPRDFMYSQNIARIKLRADRRQPMSLTGRGISFCHGFSADSIETYTTGYDENKQTHEERTYIEDEGKVTVACITRGPNGKGRRKIALYLREMEEGWYRIKCNRFHYTKAPLHSYYFQTFYVPQPYLTTTPRFLENRRDVGEFVRRQLEREKEQRRAEERREEERQRKRDRRVGQGAIAFGAIVGVHALYEAWRKRKDKKKFDDS
jgi:hypothetical protein